MNSSNADHTLYTVSYSGRVFAELKSLVARAAALGLTHQVLDAVKTINHRLTVYP